MKGQANLVSGVHNLKQAFEQFGSFIREYPGSVGARMLKGYNKKLEWIVTDLKTLPALPHDVADDVTKEWESDVFVVPAIQEKVSLLSPEQREMIEEAIDKMIDGKKIKLITI